MPAGNSCTVGFFTAVFLNLFGTDALQRRHYNWHHFFSILFEAPECGMMGKAGCGLAGIRQISPLSTTEDAHSRHMYVGESSRWCVSLHTAPEQPW